MKIKMKSNLSITPEVLWGNLKSTSTFQNVSAPLMHFKIEGSKFPEQWKTESYKLKLYLFGLIPLGDHKITFLKIDDVRQLLQTDESGKLMKKWHHTMRVLKGQDSRSAVFQDELFFESGILTIPTYIGVYIFFKYRHFRIKQLIKRKLLV